MTVMIVFFLIISMRLAESSSKSKIPLLDNIKTPLFAEMDLSGVNEKLEEFINTNVKNEVNESCNKQIDVAVENGKSDLREELLNTFVNQMIKLESDRSTKFKILEADLNQKMKSDLRKEMSELIRNNAELKTTVMELKTDNNDLKKTVLDLKANNNGLSKTVRELKTDKDDLKKSMMELQANNEPVALTASVTTQKSYSGGTIIPFGKVVTQTGINDVSAFIKSGKFICEKSGIYQISVTIFTHSSGATYSIFQNEKVLLTGYPNFNSGNSGFMSVSGSAVAAMSLQMNDTLSIRADSNIYVYRTYSFLAIVKIK